MGATEAVVAGLSFMRSMQAARTQNKQVAAQLALQEQQIATSRQIEDRRRQEALRREKARHQAHFGGRGITAAGGSAAAVLQGLSAKSARDRLDSDRLSQLQLLEARQNSAFRRRNNLLAPRNFLFDTALGVLKRKGPKIFGS